jgi:hypothetical protein
VEARFRIVEKRFLSGEERLFQIHEKRVEKNGLGNSRQNSNCDPVQTQNSACGVKILSSSGDPDMIASISGMMILPYEFANCPTIGEPKDVVSTGARAF